MPNKKVIEELERKYADYLVEPVQDFVYRNIELNIVPQMVSTIIGARRAGKSYRTLQAIDEAINKGIIPNRQHVCYLDFDNPVLSMMQPDELKLIGLHFLKSRPDFDFQTPIIFVFDEIYKIAGWEQYVIELSRNKNWKVLVTGSSSKMLRSDISTALRGKAVSTIVHPFSFRELLSYYKVNPEGKSSVEQAQIYRHFDEYLKWGGFPIIPQLEERLKETVLKEYFDTMILKDIIERYNVSKPQQCIYLLRFLLSNISKPFTFNSAYNALKETGMPTSKDAVANYIDWAQDSFLSYSIPIYSSSIKDQTRNCSKLYCVDWALSNANNWVWDGMHTRSLENLVFIELLRREKQVNYYLTREKRQEIDFVVSDSKGKIEEFIQVCYSISDNDVKKREVEPLLKAMKFFNVKEASVITINEDYEINEGDYTIKVLPAYKWLLNK